MLNSVSTAVLTAVAFTLVLPGIAQANNNEWKQVTVKDTVKIKLSDGSKRELKPSCSGGPILTDQGIVAGDTQYSFFINKGDSKKILLTLDGGGACWDDGTCLLSPLQPELFGGRPTYSPVVDETTESLATYDGVLDSDNPANPYNDYTRIFVPYCTGDVHWGSSDTTYYLPPLGPWTIHHRGTDNLLAVLAWLEEEGISFKNATDVSVVGASAGGYGANLAAAYVAEMTGDNTRFSLIADSSVGVIDNPAAPGLPFYETAIYNAAGTASWALAKNLPPAVFGDPEVFLAQGSANPLGFVPAMFAAVASYKPDTRLASITPNTDGVQIGFYTLMKGPGNTDPVLQTVGEWYGAMAFLTETTSSLPNYRFFIDNSDCHTYIFSGNFYTQGVAKWVSAMVTQDAAWDSVDAGAPFPPAFPSDENCLQF